MKSFLNVPKKVQYGLMLMTYLAKNEHTGGQPVSLDVVAEALQISQGFLEEIAGDLRRAGLVIGRRGRVGGYVLMRSANDITVYDVVVATHGPLAMAECATARKGFSVWGMVQDRMVETLTGITVGEFAQKESYVGV